MKIKTFFILTFTTLMVFLGGCVKQPTKSEKVIDDRPGISFRLQSGGEFDNSYTVYVDNLSVGNAGRYAAGESALRVLSGTHLVRVERNGVVLLEETQYLGDGAIREILIPDKRIEMVK